MIWQRMEVGGTDHLLWCIAMRPSISPEPKETTNKLIDQKAYIINEKNKLKFI